jgi:hypothetical protein
MYLSRYRTPILHFLFFSSFFIFQACRQNYNIDTSRLIQIEDPQFSDSFVDLTSDGFNLDSIIFTNLKHRINEIPETREIEFDTIVLKDLIINSQSKETDTGWNHLLYCKMKFLTDTIQIGGLDHFYQILYADFCGDEKQDLLIYTISGSGSFPYFIFFKNENNKFKQIYKGDELYFNDKTNLMFRFNKVLLEKRRIIFHDLLYSDTRNDGMCCPSGGTRIRKFIYDDEIQKFQLESIKIKKK